MKTTRSLESLYVPAKNTKPINSFDTILLVIRIALIIACIILIGMSVHLIAELKKPYDHELMEMIKTN